MNIDVYLFYENLNFHVAITLGYKFLEASPFPIKFSCINISKLTSILQSEIRELESRH